MKIGSIILAIFSVLILASCQDEVGMSGGSSGNTVNGETKLTVNICPDGMLQMDTRSTENDALIDNVILFVFQNNELVTKQYQSIVGENPQLELYLKANNAESPYTICAVCNMKDPESTMNRINTWEQLQNEAVVISEPDGAFSGTYVMYGSLEKVLVENGDFTMSDGSAGSSDNGNLELPVYRLGALFDVTINFDPVSDSDNFEIGMVSVCNIPKGSFLVDKGFSDLTSSEQNVLSSPDNVNDWVYSVDEAERKSRYFTDDFHPSLVQEAPEPDARWTFSTNFNLFENRRGKIDETKTDLWPTNGLPDSYKQVFKAGFVNDSKFHNTDAALTMQHPISAYASYLKIEGFYEQVMGTSVSRSQVTYYVFLGADNFSDFNVCRNTKYTCKVTIHAADEVDTRFESELISGLAVFAPSDILDSHPNAIKALVSSKGDWEAEVVDPDKTPWLELSTQETYLPRRMGTTSYDQNTGQAGLYLTGPAGMSNFYIHADEFIPDVNKPEENDPGYVRTGLVRCTLKGTDDVKYIYVRQYAAQMVVLHIKYDVHTMKEVRDTFYVERILEKKHMSWGFAHYWSFITDDLIASGQWDGLSNTRKLYQVATEGDKWGVASAYKGNDVNTLDWVRAHDSYSTEKLRDVALGYVIGKNRDRNGNGKIDSEEIFWYLPANKELQLLREALDSRYIQFDNTDDYFHSSTPSSADPEGITPGFVYYVKMNSGKDGLAWRTRPYNVISCRRRNNEWKGSQSAGGSGTVTVSPGWSEDEAIMPNN